MVEKIKIDVDRLLLFFKMKENLILVKSIGKFFYYHNQLCILQVNVMSHVTSIKCVINFEIVYIVYIICLLNNL